MTNAHILHDLHSHLSQLNTKLATYHIHEYQADLSALEEIMNQFPRLSCLKENAFAAKPDEADMLEKVSRCLDTLIATVTADVEKETRMIETEMQGTQFFSEYACKRAVQCGQRKKILAEMMAIRRLLSASYSNEHVALRSW